MQDKKTVTLAELLSIANHEFRLRYADKPSQVISNLSRGKGTFLLEMSRETAPPAAADRYQEFAQSLYDRYLLEH